MGQGGNNPSGIPQSLSPIWTGMGMWAAEQTKLPQAVNLHKVTTLFIAASAVVGDTSRTYPFTTVNGQRYVLFAWVVRTGPISIVVDLQLTLDGNDLGPEVEGTDFFWHILCF